MKNTIVIISLIFGAFLISCDDQKKKSTETPIEESSTEMPVPVLPTTESTPTQVSGNENNTNLPVGTPAVPVQTSAEGKNPEHGQPGHRCEIAVGAPLNSAPTQPATVVPAPSEPAIFSAPQPATAPTTPTVNVPTPPGMNPPHGAPGHDCSIAVGAPLKK